MKSANIEQLGTKETGHVVTSSEHRLNQQLQILPTKYEENNLYKA